MKKTFTILTLIAHFCLFAGWNEAMAQEPLDFTAYTGNPVLSHGGPGAYDESFCFLPFALWHDGLFYLYYTGNDVICLATSTDGYNFEKHIENPLLTPSSSGFDSYALSQTVIIEEESGWAMYYCGREDPGYGPGQAVGRATCDNLVGPWERLSNPVMTVGEPGEWDEGFIAPNAVFHQDTGGYIMFYSASSEFFTGYWEIGMATSTDGITWTKYDDPATPFPPYTASDPVLKVGVPGDWDEWAVWECSVINQHGFYELYYSGGGTTTSGIGYAWSDDGITWEKWPENPIYVPDDDPYAVSIGGNVEVPSLLVYNTDVFMYYDYGPGPAEIGMAVADTWVGNPEESTKYEVRITNNPNPVLQTTVFYYSLDESAWVRLEIFDSFARLVDVATDGMKAAGEHQILWYAGNLASGIYNYRLSASGKTGSGKLVKL